MPTRRSPQVATPWRSPDLRGREHPAASADISSWCGDAARLVHLARRLGAGRADARALRSRLSAELVLLVQQHAPFELEVTPRSIEFGDEPVFVAEHADAPTGDRALQNELPWVLHRDGIRGVRFERGVDEGEAAAFLDTLLAAVPSSATHEDMVTLLWEAGAEHIRFRTEEASPVRAGPSFAAHDPADMPHADDWTLPAAPAADTKPPWQEHAADEAGAAAFREAWAAERATPFAEDAERFVVSALAADPRPEVADAIAASLVTWVATCAQRSDWREATLAHDLLRRADPSGRRSAEPLAHAFSSLDGAAIAERLDEAEPGEQSHLFSFAVRVGAPALPMLIAVLGASGKARVRAGVTTALAYAFAEDPAPLGRWLGDSRWHVVRNVVFVLGQIGGVDAVPHLAAATRHVDMRVRRAAIHALGQVPHALRRTVLLNQLDHSDGRLLAAALAMLSREPDARVSEALLARVRAPEFEARPEEQRIALITALSDATHDAVVPTLEGLLVRGGWFARSTPERTAAARTLARIGTPAARTVLELGQRHRSEAVRAACGEALAQWRRV